MSHTSQVERKLEIFEQLEQVAILPDDWEIQITAECSRENILDLDLLQSWLEKNMVLNDETDLLEDCTEIDCRAQVAEEVKIRLEKSEELNQLIRITKLINSLKLSYFNELGEAVIAKDEAINRMILTQINEVKKCFDQVVSAAKIRTKSELINNLLKQGEVTEEDLRAVQIPPLPLEEESELGEIDEDEGVDDLLTAFR